MIVGFIRTILVTLTLSMAGPSFIAAVSAQGDTPGQTSGQAQTDGQTPATPGDTGDDQAATNDPSGSGGEPQAQEQTDLSESAQQAELPFGLTFSGDFRLRYENTTNQEPNGLAGLEARHRGVVRARWGITKDITDTLSFGARLVTGDSGNPNTTDVTLGEFADGLEFSFDRVYLDWSYQGLALSGGKFANPFRRTGLVWDGDVHPQGAAWSYTYSGSERITPKFTGMYYIVDEQTLHPDSSMWGGQADVVFRPTSEVSFSVAGAFYDYSIRSLVNADAGDTRTNRLNHNGDGFLSDFDLVDTIATFEYTGLPAPIRFVGNFVKNLGAARKDEDTGFRLDTFVGQLSERNDWRFLYGYAQAGTDSVLAAFSQDDITYGTNYRQNTVAFEFVAGDNTVLNATWYLFRRLNVAENVSDEWISRLRLNAIVSF